MTRSAELRARAGSRARCCARWPLPAPDGDADKGARGRLLVVAGSAELPGAAILAANAALRSGVGKVCIATERSIARGVALAVPEARVVAIRKGGRGHATLAEEADRFDALLMGPGITDPHGALHTCMRDLQARISPVVLDAGALDLLSTRGAPTACIVTPHMGEMAHLLQRDRDFVEANAAAVARDFAAAHGAVVALKGPTTFIADPGGDLWVHDQSNPGLAISGSGDVLAGIIAALAARGATCAQAAVWGVALARACGAAPRRAAWNGGRSGARASRLRSHRAASPWTPQLVAGWRLTTRNGLLRPGNRAHAQNVIVTKPPRVLD